MKIMRPVKIIIIQSAILFVIAFFIFYWGDTRAHRIIKESYPHDKISQEQIDDKVRYANKVKHIAEGIAITSLIFMLTSLIITRYNSETKDS